MAARMRMDCIDMWPEDVVNWYRVVPALMKKKEGGATPVGGAEEKERERERERE